ncbi:MAG: hypothetical protein ABI721_02980 [Candidatus Dojkabacteria bacterium]
MLRRLNLKTNLLLLSIPAFVLISFGLFIGNNIFYFSDFKPSIEVKYSSENSGKLKELLDKTVILLNVAKVDRSENIVEFQTIDFSEVKNNIDNLIKDYPEVTVKLKEVSELKRNNLTLLIGAFYLLFLSAAAIHFYFISGKGGDLKYILGSYLVLFFGITFSAIIDLGILSLISRYYKVTSLALTLTLLGSLSLFFIYYLSSDKVNEVNTFSYLGSIYRKFVDKYNREILSISAILIAITTIGLGSNFVIPAALILVFILVSLFTIHWIGYILENNTNLKISFIERFNKLKSLRKKKSQPQPQKTSKKKEKKKKGKKK